MMLYRKVGKRLLDILFVIASIPFAVPLIFILAALVFRDSGSPFFGHPRIGKGGTTFNCWKLRSMVPEAEKNLKLYLEQNAHARAEWEENFKLEDDPRVTRLGNFLRRSSLDELPQLWNILTGDMSMVGPRPVTMDELVRYGPYVREYSAMRPGLTGLWQVSGRNDVSYEERVLLDVAYVRNCNIVLDAKIIMRTIMVVALGTGK